MNRRSFFAAAASLLLAAGSRPAPECTGITGEYLLDQRRWRIVVQRRGAADSVIYRRHLNLAQIRALSKAMANATGTTAVYVESVLGT